LYNFLRPTAVLKYPMPLNSDAFSGFGTYSQTDNDEVVMATKMLLTQTIPAVASMLEKRVLMFVNSKQLINIIHEHGINVRYLGILRSHIQNKYIRRFILAEMISRVIKNTLREKMRDLSAAIAKKNQEIASKKLRGTGEGLEIGDTQYKQVAVHYFNLVLGRSEKSDR